jgi:hypothetical protein
VPGAGRDSVARIDEGAKRLVMLGEGGSPTALIAHGTPAKSTGL